MDLNKEDTRTIGTITRQIDSSAHHRITPKAVIIHLVLIDSVGRMVGVVTTMADTSRCFLPRTTHMATASSIVSKPMIALLPTSFSSPIQTGGHRTPDRHIQQHNLLMGHQKEGRGNGSSRLEAALSQAQIASTSHRPRQAEKTGRMQSRRVMSTVCELPNVPCHRLGQPQIKNKLARHHLPHSGKMITNNVMNSLLQLPVCGPQYHPLTSS